MANGVRASGGGKSGAAAKKGKSSRTGKAGRQQGGGRARNKDTRPTADKTANASGLGASVAVYHPEPVFPPKGPREAHHARAASDVAGLTTAQLQEIFRAIYETRRLEQTLVALYRQNKVVGGVYGSLGQEGTAVGCAYAMREGDFVQPLIRDLGAMLVHGVSPLALLRQYMARGTSPSAGRDLNTHFSDPQVGILGPISMLGAMVPVLSGCLVAARARGENKAGLCFIGDGGSSTGAFYEGLGFAAVQKLPLIAVIEANRYAYSTPTEQQLLNGDLITRALGFGVPVYHVDGNDALACYEATNNARQRAVAGAGVSIVVAETYRRKGHAEHDNQAYVPEGEIEAWASQNDPLQRYEEFLLQNRHVDAEALTAIREDVDQQLAAARDQAEAESFPAAETATWSVFANENNPFPPRSTWFRGPPPHRASG